MTGRPHATLIYNALKTSVKQLITDVGGIDAAAACTRGSRSLFSEYGKVASDRHIPVDMLLDLETIGGTPHVTAALARAQGFRLVAIDARPADEVAAALARIGASTSTLFSTAAVALADGVVSPDETIGLTRDLEATSRLISEALALLRNGPGEEL